MQLKGGDTARLWHVLGAKASASSERTPRHFVRPELRQGFSEGSEIDDVSVPKVNCRSVFL